MVSALGAFARPAGLQLVFSQSYSGARGRGKKNPQGLPKVESLTGHTKGPHTQCLGKLELQRQLRTTNTTACLNLGAQ